MTTDNSRADALNTTKLPDGSGFAIASLPLPSDHWIYAPRCAEWDGDRDTSADTPRPILTHEHRDAVVAAVRYAIRGATMCGQEMDFDPDALVLNAAYALCGPLGGPVEQHEAAPAGMHWIAFADAAPPIQDNGRGDSARRKVLVTNNISARDAFGDPSHVWLGNPCHDDSDGWYVYGGGRFLTHWADPFSISQPEPQVADERAALPRYTEWLHLRTHGEWSSGVPEWARDHTGRMNDFTAASAVIEELAARASSPTVPGDERPEPGYIASRKTITAVSAALGAVREYANRRVADQMNHAVNMLLDELGQARASSPNAAGAEGFTYATKQATACASCGEHKHTPLRIDWMGGYVCLTCIDRELESRAPAQAAEPAALPQPVLDALRFYANGHHYNIDDDHQSFDTVSGEPQNWLCSERDDDCTMIEDGSIAKAALCGGLLGFEEPEKPLEGEVFAAAPQPPAPASSQATAEQTASEMMVAARNARMFQDVRSIVATCADRNARAPYRHVEAQRVLPLLDGFLGEGYTGRVMAFKRALAAPASYDGNHVENHCPECGQYESECECAPASAPVGLTDAQRDVLGGNFGALEQAEDLCRAAGNDSSADGLNALSYALRALLEGAKQ